MQLLISVTDAEEACTALAGGADIVDAKDPAAGALGPVSSEALRAIRNQVPGERPLSAALGEARNAGQVRAAVRSGRDNGLAFVKLGFTGLADPEIVGRLLMQAVVAAREVATPPGVVAVAYADWRRAGSVDAEALLALAERSGAAGVLVDTAFKDGGQLLDLYTLAHLGRIVDQAHACGLFLALGGGLRVEQLAELRQTGADIVGIRGAACDGGRSGSLSEAKVRGLKAALMAG